MKNDDVSMSIASTDKQAALKDLMIDYPESEVDEVLEEQRRQDVKQKALEKVKFEKELEEELETLKE